jgi:hypothetical protein
MFQLTPIEKAKVVTDCDHLKQLRFSPVLPNVFTEHGAIMVAAVINSPRAVEMSIFVVRAFVKLREQLSMTRELEKRLSEIEKKLLIQGVAVRDLYRLIQPLLLPPPDRHRRKIGFHVGEKKVKYPMRMRKKAESMKYELEPFHRNIPDSDLLADLKRVAKEIHKSSVTINEYNALGQYGARTLSGRFRSWFGALEKAGLNKTCNLHISDEELFKPWCKGGETVLSNLQILCNKCNAGKSDIEFKGNQTI